MGMERQLQEAGHPLLRDIRHGLLLVVSLVMVLGGGFLVFVGVVGMGGANDPEFGGVIAAISLLSLVVGLALTVGGALLMRRLIRRSETQSEATATDLQRADREAATPPPPRAARTEVWRVLLAGVLVAIALGGVVVAHRYPRERYTHLVNCHQGL